MKKLYIIPRSHGSVGTHTRYTVARQVFIRTETIAMSKKTIRESQI